MNPDRCCVGRCKSKVELTYCARPLCKRHWDRVCGLLDDGASDKVATMLNLPAPQIVERMEEEQ